MVGRGWAGRPAVAPSAVGTPASWAGYILPRPWLTTARRGVRKRQAPNADDFDAGESLFICSSTIQPASEAMASPTAPWASTARLGDDPLSAAPSCRQPATGWNTSLDTGSGHHWPRGKTAGRLPGSRTAVTVSTRWPASELTTARPTRLILGCTRGICACCSFSPASGCCTLGPARSPVIHPAYTTSHR